MFSGGNSAKKIEKSVMRYYKSGIFNEKMNRLTLMANRKLNAENMGNEDNKQAINNSIKNSVDTSFIKIKNLMEETTNATGFRKKIMKMFQNNMKKIEKIREDFLQEIVGICTDNGIESKESIESIKYAALAELYTKIVSDSDLHEKIADSIYNNKGLLAVTLSGIIITILGVVLVGTALAGVGALIPLLASGLTLYAGGIYTAEGAILAMGDNFDKAEHFGIAGDNKYEKKIKSHPRKKEPAVTEGEDEMNNADTVNIVESEIEMEEPPKGKKKKSKPSNESKREDTQPLLQSDEESDY